MDDYCLFTGSCGKHGWYVTGNGRKIWGFGGIDSFLSFKLKKTTDNDYGKRGKDVKNLDPVQFEKDPVTSLMKRFICSKIAVGADHSIFLFERHRGKGSTFVYGMGYNTCGQLGNGDNKHVKDHLERVAFPFIGDNSTGERITDVFCGYNFSHFSGTRFLWGAGENGQGQLGCGTDKNEHHPVKSLFSEQGYRIKINQVVGGWDHGVFLDSHGVCYAAGTNGHGELGLGESCSRVSLPTKVLLPPSAKIAFLACGYYHTLFLTRKPHCEVYWTGTLCGEAIFVPVKLAIFVPVKSCSF